jgi:hypothetical protein
MKRQKRPALKFNIIAPLVRLVLGYHGNHKTDITFQPGSDDARSEQTRRSPDPPGEGDRRPAAARIRRRRGVPRWPDLGRGFYDTRLDWETTTSARSRPRRSTRSRSYIDPDADTYDLNESASFMQTAKMVSIDEIEGGLRQEGGRAGAALHHGADAAGADLQPRGQRRGHAGALLRRARGRHRLVGQFYSLMGDFVDTYRKTIRIIETQYKVREPRNVIIDLETGDKKVLPEIGARQDREGAAVRQRSATRCMVQRAWSSASIGPRWSAT